MLLGGNLDAVKPEIGRYDASEGALISWRDGRLQTRPAQDVGLRLRGEVRDAVTLVIDGRDVLLVARNDESLQAFIRGRPQTRTQ